MPSIRVMIVNDDTINQERSSTRFFNILLSIISIRCCRCESPLKSSAVCECETWIFFHVFSFMDVWRLFFARSFQNRFTMLWDSSPLFLLCVWIGWLHSVVCACCGKKNICHSVVRFCNVIWNYWLVRNIQPCTHSDLHSFNIKCTQTKHSNKTSQMYHTVQPDVGSINGWSAKTAFRNEKSKIKFQNACITFEYNMKK